MSSLATFALGAWMVLTIVGLFGWAPGRALRRRDHFGLLPRPILFAPRPVNGDRIVLVAHREPGAVWSEWIDLNTPHLAWRTAWWRPSRRIVTLSNSAITVVMGHALRDRTADLRLVSEYLFLAKAAEAAVPRGAEFRFALAEVRGVLGTPVHGVPLFVSSRHRRAQ